MSVSNLRPLPAFPEPNSKAFVRDANGAIAPVCDLCHNSGFEVVPGKGARRCSCRTSAANTQPLGRVRIPELYSACTLTNYLPASGNMSQLRALTYARGLVAEYPRNRRGLLLMGSVGTGKTHLATATLRALAERKYNCLFYNFGTLLKEVQAAYDKSTGATETGVLAPVLGAEVLVLDELGATKPTEWVRETMLYIVNARYEQQRTTIFTTNYLDVPAEAEEETLEDRIGVRLRSRLHQMCQVVQVEGNDYRRGIKCVSAFK